MIVYVFLRYPGSTINTSTLPSRKNTRAVHRFAIVVCGTRCGFLSNEISMDAYFQHKVSALIY